MHRLPDQAWGYANIAGEETQRNLAQAVAVLYVAENQNRQVHAIGACFRVCNSKQFAVLVTASHILEQAAKCGGPRRLSHRYVEEWSNKDHLEVVQRMALYWSHLPSGNLPRVAAYHGAPSTDIGCIVARLPEHLSGSLPPPVVIDSDLLVPGTRIFVAVPSKLVLENVREDVYKIGPELQLRYGEITAGPVRARLIKAPVYETSIPFLPGMSGSPVFAQLGSRNTLCAIGVVSSDFSTDEAHATPGTAGRSAVIPIGYAYALRIGAATLPDGSDTFDAFCRQGAVIDLGARKDKIEVTREGQNWRVFLPTA